MFTEPPLEKEHSTALTAKSALRRQMLWKRLAVGFALGAFVGLGAAQLGFQRVIHLEDEFLLAGLLGAVMALTRARRLLWAAALTTVALLLAVGYTPLVPALMRGWVCSDPLQPAPAVVVLSASAHKDKSMSASMEDRILQGYALLRQGYAPRLVLTNAAIGNGTEVPTIRQQMRLLGLNYPIDEAGPVRDTHDEALEVARLARQRGWSRVLLVTHPSHMRRAAAVFERAGVHVLCCPCNEGGYDLSDLRDPRDRLHAFRDWLHETIGYLVYRWRGWI
ncbi:MAG TPA: YdcF family protein [Chthonomonadaceae bacterium]|nr:YdcF family protein [Chthonomonadaceae bacterium]